MLKKFYFENKKVILLIVFCFSLYYIFYFIFFVIFKSLSVEGFVGLNILLMFAYIYRFFGSLINSFFLNISKAIWLHFITLINLVISLKDLILEINYNYLELLQVQIYSLNSVYIELVNNFNENYYLFLKNFVLNYLSFNFFYKINFIKFINNNVINKFCEIKIYKINYFYIINCINMKIINIVENLRNV